MTERIDHVAEARRTLRCIRGVDEQTNQITLVLDAQVHATLALVEQQRLANLIALHRHEVKHDIGSWSRLYDGYENLKPEIAEGLGL